MKVCWPLLLFSFLFTASPGFSAPAKTKPKKPDEAPFVFLPPCPGFHVIDGGMGETKIDVLLNTPASERTGWRLEVKMSDADGHSVQSVMADASRGTMCEAKLRVPLDGPAHFHVQTRLADASAKELGSAESNIHVIPREECRVGLLSDGFLEISNKPSFVVGMYSSGHYPEMAAAGFNATHSYAIVTGAASNKVNLTDVRLQMLLDNNWSNGMRMMVELPREAIEKADWDQVIRRIETFKHHPGLLCWGSEERVARGRTSITNMASLYQLVHRLDPDHPLVLGDTKKPIPKAKDKKIPADRRDFFPDPYMDIGVWWWYPIPLKDPDGNGLLEGHEKAGIMFEGPSWLTTTFSKKPLWIAIQSYEHPNKEGRFPTPDEYRDMAYLSIIYGVKGLWFYTGSGQKDFHGRPAGLLNKPEEGHWDYVRKLVTELQNFSPVIMASKAETQVMMTPTNAPIEFTTREWSGSTYLIAANRAASPQQVEFASPSFNGKKAEVLFEPKTDVSKGGELKATFRPFGVHIFKLAGN